MVLVTVLAGHITKLGVEVGVAVVMVLVVVAVVVEVVLTEWDKGGHRGRETRSQLD